MQERVTKFELKIDKKLLDFINEKVIPGTDLVIEDFWEKTAVAIKKLSPKNKDLLEKRQKLKKEIDSWNIRNKGNKVSYQEYKTFLQDIGYLIEEGSPFKIDTNNVDPEIATISGPQLVVPITNARYALNAANARWGSLYDALYGTDAMGSLPENPGYDEERGKKVIEYAKKYLDKIFTLKIPPGKI